MGCAKIITLLFSVHYALFFRTIASLTFANLYILKDTSRLLLTLLDQLLSGNLFRWMSKTYPCHTDTHKQYLWCAFLPYSSRGGMS